MGRVIVFTVCIFCMVTAPVQSQTISENDLEKLASTMAGEFSSEEQSKQDSSYFHIKLRMKPMWKNRKDGHWFYVEQSVATAQDKPYRQRVYHLYKHDDTTVVSKVYEIKNPLHYTGGWQDETILAALSEDSLIDRQGCAIYLRNKEKNVFRGSTRDKECLSSLRGAAYATSEVTIFNDTMISWDRGWDHHGKQVWGAEKGGYVFKKKRDLK